jgi:7,8-dihydroneopterin aldolase/epimerase/oxygenase
MAGAGGKALAGAVRPVIHRVVDIIRIAGIKSFGHHGALPEEKRLGQRFTVSVDLEVDTRPAAAADDLKLTVDYAEVIRTVEAQLTGKPVYLIETLAQQIAARILGTFLVVKAVTVEVTKPFAPVAAEFDAISVKIRRERA